MVFISMSNFVTFMNLPINTGLTPVIGEEETQDVLPRQPIPKIVNLIHWLRKMYACYSLFITSYGKCNSLTFFTQTGKIFFWYWNYMTYAEDFLHFNAFASGLDVIFTWRYVRGNSSKGWRLRGSLECSFKKYTKFPFYRYQTLFNLIYGWFYMN